MSKVISLYPTKITQPNANTRNPIKKWSFQEVRRGGKAYSYGSANPTDPRYFHTWTNTSNLLNGGKTQCGRPNTYHCSHKTYYSIKGYRNTCPIAGCNGTYNAPATLQLHFSKEALESKGMTENSKIEQIKIVFQHACTGVDVGSGKETTVWGPNFDGYKTYPNLEALKVFFTNANKVRTGEVQNTQGDSFNYGNPPLSKTFSTVTAIFDFKNAHSTLSDIGLLSSGAFNIIYGRNLSTNPGNIYLKNAIIKIKFSEPKLFIEGQTSGKVIYTSSQSTCQTKLNHIITAGYKDNTKILSNAAAPKTITSKNIAVHAPKGVTYTVEDHEGHQMSYMIWDESNQTGDKQIEYKIKGTDKSITIPYTAKKYNPSLIKVPKTVFYDLNAEEASDTLIVKNGCLFKLEIYLDSLNKRIMSITKFTKDGPTNWITKTDIISFGKIISKQKCGKHTLYFRRNNESNKDITSISYTVKPRTYRFQFTCEEAGYTEDTQTFEFNKNTGDEGKQTITIKRVDNHQPVKTPKFLIVENTLDEELNTNIMNQSKIEEIAINKSVNIDVFTKNIGQFYISIQEYNQQCDTQEDTRDIIINQNHIQHHDIVYVRGEDSTSFDYKYIAVWEGDEVRCPIDVTDVSIITQNNDIHVCTKGLYQAGLSQTGIAQIVVHNQSQYKKDLQNIDLEINVLDNNFEVTTEDFFEHVSGMLSNLYNNFEIYNPYILDNVSLKHLTPDDDVIEEENVYLHINELPYNEKITINIPFQSNISKTINMQFLLFGEVLPLYQKDNCQIPLRNNYITLSTADSIMTQLTIDGITNMHYPNIWYDLKTGEPKDSCPNECFNTKKNQNEWWYKPQDTTINGGITYTIQNLESATSINNSQIIISNDKEVIPFGWVYENNYCFLDAKSEYQYCQNCPNSQNCPIRWIYEDQESFDNPIINGLITLITHFPAYDETIVKQRTDKNGETTFLIEIPDDLDSKYTISQLINENIIALKFDGNSQTQACEIGNANIVIDQKLSPSHMDYVDSFRKYYPGQVIELHIKLTRSTTQPINDIILDIKRLESNETKQLTVFYKICNLENNQGIFNTTLKTNSINMIPNETTQPLYCGINTDIKVYTNIKKKIVEKDTLNTIYLSILNKKRDNHNIICDIKLGQVNQDTDVDTDIDTDTNINTDIDTNTNTDTDTNTDTNKKRNIYTLTDIDIDTGTYVYDKESNKITWFIGSMKAEALTQATIIIKGEEIGPSNIHITTTDFLKDLDCDEEELGGQKVIDIIGHYLCSDCSKQN